jgi:hypothetical protein
MSFTPSEGDPRVYCRGHRGTLRIHGQAGVPSVEDLDKTRETPTRKRNKLKTRTKETKAEPGGCQNQAEVRARRMTSKESRQGETPQIRTNESERPSLHEQYFNPHCEEKGGCRRPRKESKVKVFSVTYLLSNREPKPTTRV